MEAVLVTGGAGFIGSHFVRTLLRRHPETHIHILDALTYAGDLDNLAPDVLTDRRVHFWYGNVCDSDLVSEIMAHVDTVVHFAAESHVARSISSNAVFYESDVLGTQVVASHAVKQRRRVRRFVHISTSEVYGSAVTRPMTEDHPLLPLSPYASAKCGADRLVYSYWRTYNLPAVIVRPFNQYGPRQHPEKCVPRFLTSAFDNQPLTVHGDGSAARDWCYVGDTCDALMRVLEAPLDAIMGEVINLGTGRPTNILTVARKTLTILGADPQLIRHIDNRPGQVDLHVSSTDKAQRLLGWRAQTTVDEGLRRTVKWYREHEEWWRKRLWMQHVPVQLTNGCKVMQ